MFLGNGVLKICNKFTGEHPCRSAISIKLQSNLHKSNVKYIYYIFLGEFVLFIFIINVFEYFRLWSKRKFTNWDPILFDTFKVAMKRDRTYLYILLIQAYLKLFDASSDFVKNLFDPSIYNKHVIPMPNGKIYFVFTLLYGSFVSKAGPDPGVQKKRTPEKVNLIPNFTVWNKNPLLTKSRVLIWNMAIVF